MIPESAFISSHPIEYRLASSESFNGTHYVKTLVLQGLVSWTSPDGQSGGYAWKTIPTVQLTENGQESP